MNAFFTRFEADESVPTREFLTQGCTEGWSKLDTERHGVGEQ